MNRFKEFLRKRTAFNDLSSLFTKKKGKSIILLSDLPYVHDKRDERDEILMTFCCPQKPKKGRNPIVILHTVYDSPTLHSSLYRTFPSKMITSPNIEIIELKPFTVTAIVKKLQNILSLESKLEQSKNINLHVSKEKLKQIATRAEGDLRQAIQQLQFHCMRLNKKDAQAFKKNIKLPKMVKIRRPSFNPIEEIVDES